MGDPIIARTIALTAGLREPAQGDGADVLGIYSNCSGEEVFSIEREGLRLLHRGELARYRDIASLKLDPRVKFHDAARNLILVMADGRRILLPVDGTVGQFLDIFPIHAFVRRRIHQLKARKPLSPE